MTPKRMVAVSFAAVAAFLAYSFLPLAAPPAAASPDENANRYFAGLFADTGALWRFDSLNLSVPGLIHPRSVRVVGDFQVPGGFLGLPVLYGGMAKALGKGALPYLTPLFALLGAAAWGLLAARFFGRTVGAAAALLLAAHPAWWYEAARTLQPNVLFLSLAAVAAWLLLAAPIAHVLAGRDGLPLLKNADGPLAGIACSLALAVRPSEAYWMALAGLVLLGFAAPRGAWKRLAFFALFAALAAAPFLFLNKSVYGAYLSTGYGSAVDVPVASLPRGGGAALLGPLRPYLFPLGFAPRDALRHFLVYGIGFFWWWSALVAAALVGLAVEARRAARAGGRIPWEAKAFSAAALAASLWLILFYGSWSVQDNPDPAAVTIGSSYLRYWLPIFLFSTLPVAWLIVRAGSLLPVSKRRALYAVFFGLFLLASAADVFLSPQEGLLALRENLAAEDAAARMIVRETPEKALVVVDRADKFVFPERRVIYPLRSEETYAAIAKVKELAPVFYFGITLPERDLEWLAATKLPPLGLSIDPVATSGDSTLYRFSKLKTP